MSKSSALSLELNERTARAHMDYFLDESGSSGDLIHTAASLDFGGAAFLRSRLHRYPGYVEPESRHGAAEAATSTARR